MSPIIAIMRRDLRKYFRSPVLMVVSLFLPLLQLVIIGHAFGGQIRNVSVALVSLDNGPEAVRVQQAFRAIEENASTFRVTLENDLDTALDERRYLHQSIGVAGMLALQPLQTTSDRDAWHRHLLKSRGSAAGR